MRSCGCAEQRTVGGPRATVISCATAPGARRLLWVGRRRRGEELSENRSCRQRHSPPTVPQYRLAALHHTLRRPDT